MNSLAIIPLDTRIIKSIKNYSIRQAWKNIKEMYGYGYRYTIQHGHTCVLSRWVFHVKDQSYNEAIFFNVKKLKLIRKSYNKLPDL